MSNCACTACTLEGERRKRDQRRMLDSLQHFMTDELDRKNDLLEKYRDLARAADALSPLLHSDAEESGLGAELWEALSLLDSARAAVAQIEEGGEQRSGG